MKQVKFLLWTINAGIAILVFLLSKVAIVWMEEMGRDPEVFKAAMIASLIWIVVSFFGALWQTD